MGVEQVSFEARGVPSFVWVWTISEWIVVGFGLRVEVAYELGNPVHYLHLLAWSDLGPWFTTGITHPPLLIPKEVD